MTITEFLLARIAEDEGVARAAARDGERWRTLPEDYRLAVAIDNGTAWGGEPVAYDEGCPSEEQSAHIARHDPARVLAGCDAQRRIVELHPIYREGPRLLDVGIPQGVALGGCEFCHCVDRINADATIEAIGPCETLCLLASVYADHPDFQDEWRPVG